MSAVTYLARHWITGEIIEREPPRQYVGTAFYYDWVRRLNIHCASCGEPGVDFLRRCDHRPLCRPCYEQGAK
jgi:hypothetical protein